MVKIGILTSSRADFGIYLPLLNVFRNDIDIDFDIIAFGTHLSPMHGETVLEIQNYGFEVKHKIPSMLSSDTEESIATSVGLTFVKFSSFWNRVKDEYDIILCLGDRFEMFAAVLSGVPFGIRYAHFYGGDSSKGAIDNVYRDCITMASKLHFTSTDSCAARVSKLVNFQYDVYSVGIMSLENVKSTLLLSVDEFRAKWIVDLSIPTVLITFHSETVDSENNFRFATVVRDVIKFLVPDFQLIITMPNGDTNGSMYRSVYNESKVEFSERIYLFENLGSESYFSCLKYVKFVIGNTSSGISEAPSFNKYFINVGDRQKGREMGRNVLSVGFDIDEIRDAVMKVMEGYNFNGINIYHKEGSLGIVVNAIKNYPFGEL